MVQVSFLRPIDQFKGNHRLLDELKDALQSNSFNHLRIAVAFAKSGPLLRLASLMKEWKQKGKTSEAIIGVDLQGTTRQALELALQFFDKTYVLHSTSYATFHPKTYLFYGDTRAICFQGSHNLTVGGTETNLEAGVKIEFERPQDEESFQSALSSWSSLLPNGCEMSKPLDKTLLEALFADGIVIDENAAQIKKKAEGAESGKEATPKTTLFPKLFPKPATPLPKEVVAQIQPTVPKTAISSEALVIQIIPHGNGEVHLSNTAIKQNPEFFGFPFTGMTAPKFAKNPSYPQRTPDPLVNVVVYNAAGNEVLIKKNFAMNTVHYTTKSEIRITFSPDLIGVIEPYAIMVMRRAETHDYDIEIFNPGSPPSKPYKEYLEVCNQTMPSGGKAEPRKMGWL